MSRIGGNQGNPDRDPTDLYPTEVEWTRALLAHVRLRGRVWECAAGEMDMVKELKRQHYRVRATDILTGVDFLATTKPWEGSIVTNPPYRLADEFIHHALQLASEHVAMLLPIGALGGKTRYQHLWSKRRPSHVIVVCSRMKVRGEASQFNHVWAVWDLRSRAKTKVEWTL